MNLKRISAIALAIMFAATAWSGEKAHREMTVEVIAQDGHEKTVVVLDSDDMGFDMQGMQIGENHSVVDESGQAVLITRTEDGYSFDVGGQIIDMPSFEEFGGDNVWVHGNGEGNVDVDVHVISDGQVSQSMDIDGVMIFSGKDIDEATQQVIRMALESAGHSNVNFAGSDAHGEQQVHVIRKVHKITE